MARQNCPNYDVHTSRLLKKSESASAAQPASTSARRRLETGGFWVGELKHPGQPGVGGLVDARLLTAADAEQIGRRGTPTTRRQPRRRPAKWPSRRWCGRTWPCVPLIQTVFSSTGWMPMNSASTPEVCTVSTEARPSGGACCSVSDEAQPIVSIRPRTRREKISWRVNMAG